MSKYCGMIGFAVSSDNGHGVWTKVPTERKYYGDKIDKIRYQTNDKVVNDIVVTGTFEIVADSFARDNLGGMLYLTYMGQKWKIESVDPRYPRIVISIGGLYNG